MMRTQKASPKNKKKNRRSSNYAALFFFKSHILLGGLLLNGGRLDFMDEGYRRLKREITVKDTVFVNAHSFLILLTDSLFADPENGFVLLRESFKSLLSQI